MADRTVYVVMGIFPTAQLLYCARAEDTPRCSAAGGWRFVLAALLCTPIYVYGVCIEDACAVLLFRVAVSLSLRVFTWSGRAFSPLQPDRGVNIACCP